MRLLHTMLRVKQLDESLSLLRQSRDEAAAHRIPGGEFTARVVGYRQRRRDRGYRVHVELGTAKYDLGNAYGHVALGVEDI